MLKIDQTLLSLSINIFEFESSLSPRPPSLSAFVFSPCGLFWVLLTACLSVCQFSSTSVLNGMDLGAWGSPHALRCCLWNSSSASLNDDSPYFSPINKEDPRKSVFFLRLSPSDDRWCEVTGFAPAGSLKLPNTLACDNVLSRNVWLQNVHIS